MNLHVSFAKVAMTTLVTFAKIAKQRKLKLQ